MIVKLQKAVSVYDVILTEAQATIINTDTQPEVIQNSDVVQQLRLQFGFVYL
jgi:hypothetical protein